jgi:hypothetical protein
MGYFDVVCKLLEDSRVDPGTDGSYAVQCASPDNQFDIGERILGDERVDFLWLVKLRINIKLFMRAVLLNSSLHKTRVCFRKTEG